MIDKVEQIIISSLAELNEELEDSRLNTPSKETKLFGSDGALDSLALVSLITDLEERISDELDKDIVIADERAMSKRSSPFKDVASLTAYICNLIEE